MSYLAYLFQGIIFSLWILLLAIFISSIGQIIVEILDSKICKKIYLSWMKFSRQQISPSFNSKR